MKSGCTGYDDYADILRICGGFDLKDRPPGSFRGSRSIAAESIAAESIAKVQPTGLKIHRNAPGPRSSQRETRLMEVQLHHPFSLLHPNLERTGRGA